MFGIFIQLKTNQEKKYISNMKESHESVNILSSFALK